MKETIKEFVDMKTVLVIMSLLGLGAGEGYTWLHQVDPNAIKQEAKGAAIQASTSSMVKWNSKQEDQLREFRERIASLETKVSMYHQTRRVP